MARTITVTLEDGSTHTYQNAPDNITPDQVTARAQQDFGKKVTALDGGRATASTTTTPPESKGLLGQYADALAGGPEYVAHLGTAIVAKPLSEIAGMGAVAHDLVTGNKDGDPAGFKNYIQNALTYQPRTETGKALSTSLLNPVNALGAGLGATGNAAANLVAGDNPGSIRKGIADATREAVPQLVGYGIGKIAPVAAMATKRGVNALADTINPTAQAGATVNRLAGDNGAQIADALEGAKPNVENSPVTARDAIAQANLAQLAKSSPVTPPGVTISKSDAPITESITMPEVGQPAPAATGVRHEYIAKDKSGNVIGTASYRVGADGKAVPEHIEVNPDMQGQGVGQALHAAAAKELGRLQPAPATTAAGGAFQDKVLPQVNTQPNSFGGSLVRLQDDLTATKGTPTASKDALNTAYLNQELARKNALGTIAKTPELRAAADAARTGETQPLYDAVKNSVGGVDTRASMNMLDDTINRNIGNPDLVAPLKTIRASLKLADGNAEKVSSVLDGIKIQLRKQETDPFVKSQLLAIKDQITKDLPGQVAADTKYAELSQPINRMDIGQTLLNKLDGPRGERAGPFSTAMENVRNTTKKATGFARDDFGQALNPDEMKAAMGVQNDLAVEAYANKMSRDAGTNGTVSSTPELPNMLSRPAMAANYVLKTFGHDIDAKTRAVLSDMMLNPEKLAAELRKPPGTPLHTAAVRLLKSTQGGAVGMGLQDASSQNALSP